jgi:voltage-gated potassium channel
MSDDLRTRLLGGFVALALVIFLGSLGYYLLGDGRWDFSSCLYMTVITLTTVGFGEVLPNFDHVDHVRGFTVVLIVFGMGTFLYFASTLTAVIIEGDLRAAMRRTRMRKQIAKLQDHFIVCGLGSTGGHIVEELVATKRPVLGIDTNTERLEQLYEEFDSAGFVYIVGDATDDKVLEEANIGQARGLVSALASDKDNLYVVVSARQANPGARIVARGSDLPILEKLKKAGADTVVSPNYIGGLRMVSEMIRPQVVQFLDVMLRDKKKVIRIDEVRLSEGSSLHGKKLAEAALRSEEHVTVLAVRDSGQKDYLYNPAGDFELRAGQTLVVLGALDDVDRLRKAAQA